MLKILQARLQQYVHVKAVAKRQTVHYEQSAIAAIVAELEREL